MTEVDHTRGATIPHLHRRKLGLIATLLRKQLHYRSLCGTSPDAHRSDSKYMMGSLRRVPSTWKLTRVSSAVQRYAIGSMPLTSNGLLSAFIPPPITHSYRQLTSFQPDLPTLPLLSYSSLLDFITPSPASSTPTLETNTNIYPPTPLLAADHQPFPRRQPPITSEAPHLDSIAQQTPPLAATYPLGTSHPSRGHLAWPHRGYVSFGSSRPSHSQQPIETSFVCPVLFV